MNGDGPPVARGVRRVKLAIPPAIPDAIDRPALLARLDAAVAFPLTRVIAGAGYGKTTLLAAWARQTSLPVAWISLDSADADLGRFAAHLAAAIRQSAPGSLPGMEVLLAGSRALDPVTFADVLADDLLDLEQPVALVLDDLHAIAGSPAERALDLLLLHPPAALRLVVGSRAEPNMPQGVRLFGRGRASVLGPADLRFAPEETAALLRPGDSRAADLTRRADGWIAGIRALAMAGPEASLSLPGAIQSLVHADVLASQPAGVAALLADVVVVERVSPGLAAALSSRPMAAAEAAELLEEAERRGLFVTRLDERGEWWRLHPLLRDALARDETAIRSAHARASEWFAAEGLPEEAIDHAIKAGRIEEAGALLADHAAAWLDGVIHSPVDWMDRLPPETLQRHPVLLVARARSLSSRVNLAGAQVARDAAAAALDALDPDRTDPRLRPLRQEVLLIDGFISMFSGDPRPLRPAQEPIITGVEPATPRLRADLQGSYDFGLAMDGRSAERIVHLKSIVDSAVSGDPIAVSSHINLAALSIRALDPAPAEALARIAMTWPDVPSLTRSRTWAAVLAALARHDQGDHEEALRIARSGLPLAPGEMIYPKSMLMVTIVRAMLAQGHLVEARAAVAENWRLVDLSGAEHLRQVSGALEARVSLAAGDIDRAARWAGGEVFPLQDGPLRGHEHPTVTQAKVWLARNGPRDAERARSALEAMARYESAIHFHLGLGYLLPVLAVAHVRLGQDPEARETMRQALALEPGRMIQRFADAGPDSLALLAAIAADPGDALAPRASSVLVSLDRHAADSALAAHDAPAAPNPLSVREVEILSLMGAWRTNKEIAEFLGISAATVHNHTIRIFRKLGVSDRRDAAEAARAAGWLPNP